MATQTIQSWAVTGETLTMKLYTQNSDTLVDSAAATEATNRDSLYAAAFTDLPADTYIVQLETAGGVVRSYYWVNTLAATGTYQAFETPAGGGGVIDANVVSFAISPESIVSAITANSITVKRGDTWSLSLNGLGDITGYQNVWFTVKNGKDIDSWDLSSMVQIDSDTGLLHINKTVATAGNGSLTVSDAAAGDIDITLDASEAVKLDSLLNAVWDLQYMTSAGAIVTLTGGTFTLSKDVTRTV